MAEGFRKRERESLYSKFFPLPTSGHPSVHSAYEEADAHLTLVPFGQPVAFAFLSGGFEDIFLNSDYAQGS